MKRMKASKTEIKNDFYSSQEEKKCIYIYQPSNKGSINWVKISSK